MDRLSGWTLFTVRGVAIRMHPSLLFLLAYVILVGMIQFPFVAELSGTSAAELAGTPWTWAILFAFSLIASILVHELGHVFVAQAQGSKVSTVTLMMLGGVSQIEQTSERPWAELKVAIIGPIVSLAIAALLITLRSASISPELSFYAYWVGRANLVLAIFNLLPAFPTDGGRVLRSILVSRRGAVRGTELAVKVSHGFAWAFGILGFLQVNVLLVLIAFMIYGAARSELFVLVGQEALKGLKVSDVMVSVPYVDEDESLSDAAARMVSAKTRILPIRSVGPGGEPPSVVTAELIEQVPRDAWETTPVRAARIPMPRAIGPHDPLEEALTIGLAMPDGAIPVSVDGKPVGMIRTADLVDTVRLRRLKEERSPPTSRAA